MKTHHTRQILIGAYILVVGFFILCTCSCENIHSSVGVFYETEDGVRFEYKAEETIKAYK